MRDTRTIIKRVTGFKCKCVNRRVRVIKNDYPRAHGNRFSVAIHRYGVGAACGRLQM